MIQQYRSYWQERAREEFERALQACGACAREAHVDLAMLHLIECRSGMDHCPHRSGCTLGTTCAVASRMAGIETLDLR